MNQKRMIHRPGGSLRCPDCGGPVARGEGRLRCVICGHAHRA